MNKLPVDFIPPDFQNSSLENFINSLLDDVFSHPYWISRHVGKRCWEVCYHETKGIVSPKVVDSFQDVNDADEFLVELMANLARTLISKATK